MKFCSKCERQKPDAAFYEPSQRIGTTWCRDCFSGYMRQRRAAWVAPANPPATKACGHCSQEKALDQFGRLRGTSTGRHSWCKACQAERARQRRADNPDAIRRIKYGMPSGQYDLLLALQGGACAVCRRKRRLVVDHDHAIGAVRGLLCKPCNTGIGFLDDCLAHVEAAADYLRINAAAKKRA